MSSSNVVPINKGKRGLLRSLSSLLSERFRFTNTAGLSFDNQRDTYATLGYDRRLTFEKYLDRYKRGGIAKKVVTIDPKATWSTPFTLRDTGTFDDTSEFQKQSDFLFKRLSLQRMLMKADVLAGLGKYSVILIGATGRLDSELPKSLGSKGVAFFTPIHEERAEIARQEENVSSPRFGLPTTYRIKLSTSITKDVHWTRILHIVDNPLNDEVFGDPRMEDVWNYLDDLDKIIGGGAEATWQRADPGMHIKMDPDIEWGPEEETDAENEIEDYKHGLSKVIQSRGLDIDLLNSQVPVFGPNAKSVISLIAATKNVPMRIFMGSELGEIASTQDRDNWFDRCCERWIGFGEPTIRKLVDRLILHGALPNPIDGEYEVVRSLGDKLGEEAKAGLAAVIAGANESQTRTGQPVLLTTDQIRRNVWGFDPIDPTDLPPRPTSSQVDNIVLRRLEIAIDHDVNKSEVLDIVEALGACTKNRCSALQDAFAVPLAVIGLDQPRAFAKLGSEVVELIADGLSRGTPTSTLALLVRELTEPPTRGDND